MGGGFSHTPVDPQESWSWIVDSLDALLRNWTAGGASRPPEDPIDKPRR
jgi:hypothetical protein